MFLGLETRSEIGFDLETNGVDRRVEESDHPAGGPLRQNQSGEHRASLRSDLFERTQRNS